MHESAFSGSRSKKNSDNSGGDDKYLYCDSLEDGDVIVEEVIEASTETLHCSVNVKRSSNPDASDLSDVILIDDDDDDCYVPCIKKSKHHGNFRCIKNNSLSGEEESKAVVVLQSSDDFIEEIIETKNGWRAVDSPTSVAKSVMESFLYELGMKLVLYNTVNSQDHSDQTLISQEFNHQDIITMSFLSLPQKYCRCGFKSESTLVFRDHLGMGKNFTQTKCCVCNKYISKYFGRFSSHMKNQHNMTVHQLPKRAAFRCRFCKFDTNSQLNMDKHRKMCAYKFSLNNNLIPTLDDQTFVCEFPSESSNVSRPTSVIHPNPQRSQSSTTSRGFVPSNSGTLHNNFTQAQQQSVIVPNKTFKSDFESGQENYEVCEYCNGVVPDLKSLARHLDVVHKIKGSFVFKCSKCSPPIICSSEEEFQDHCKKMHTKNNSKKLKPGNVNKSPPLVILDDGSSITEFCSKDLSTEKSLKCHSRLENYLSFDDVKSISLPKKSVSLVDISETSDFCNKDDLSVEIGLAKMAVRRECLWCPIEFKSLELFEDHMVNKHKDMMWDVESFWAFLETGFSQCVDHKRGEESTSCSWCSQVLPSSFLYHRHILEAHWVQHVESCAWCTEVITQPLPVAQRLHKASPEKLVNVIDLDDSCCESDNNNRESNCNDYDDDSTSTFLSNIDKEDTVSTDSCNQYSKQADEVEILDVNGEKVVVMKNV